MEKTRELCKEITYNFACTRLCVLIIVPDVFFLNIFLMNFVSKLIVHLKQFSYTAFNCCLGYSVCLSSVWWLCELPFISLINFLCVIEFLCKECPRVHIHFNRLDIREIPAEPIFFRRWLHERFEIKDKWVSKVATNPSQSPATVHYWTFIYFVYGMLTITYHCRFPTIMENLERSWKMYWSEKVFGRLFWNCCLQELQLKATYTDGIIEMPISSD